MKSSVYGEKKSKEAIRQSDTRRSNKGNGEAESGCVCKTVGFSLHCSYEVLVVQDHTEKRTVDFKLSVVANEA